jgi:serine/threonine protein kinase
VFEQPPYFVMEFFPAGNLKLRIMHKKWDFIKEKAHEIFKQAATALAYMNASGWVHRDVKPDNLIVNSAGEVRLIDFALAERVSKHGFFRRRKGRTAGTRSYMSPEQVRGESLDGRADVYSFGATMYEVITGRPPFRASSPVELLNKQITEKPLSPRSINKDVTEECAALILRMLAKKKEDRPRDFHEVLMALRGMKIFAGEPPPKSDETGAQVSQMLKGKKVSQEESPIKCPQCDSTQFSTDTQGFTIGKAAVGAVLIGPVGILGGMIGSGKINITCLKCGHVFKPGQGG